MADQLRRRVADRLTDTQQRITKLVALGGDLHQVLARLQHPAHNGPCVEGEYVCLSNETTVPPRTPLLLPNVEGDVDAELACTLHPDRMPDRMTDWQALLGRATGREPISGGVAVRFPLDLELSRELVRLASAEHDCCRFFDFALHITADGLNLRVTGPSEAQPVIAAVFGVPGTLHQGFGADGFGVVGDATLRRFSGRGLLRGARSCARSGGCCWAARGCAHGRR